ncbi:hypothetical protein SuNHUV7_40410 (plasmid) [Pseudoseohaeicola sp. NH-UV-7]
MFELRKFYSRVEDFHGSVRAKSLEAGRAVL